MRDPYRLDRPRPRGLRPDGAWPGLVQTAAFALATPLGETWEMARRDLRPGAAGHAALDTDRASFFGRAYVAAGSRR